MNKVECLMPGRSELSLADNNYPCSFQNSDLVKNRQEREVRKLIDDSLADEPII